MEVCERGGVMEHKDFYEVNGCSWFIPVDLIEENKCTKELKVATTEKFMRAWLDGYEVEKEKLYTVEIPNPNLNAYVVLQKTLDGLVLVAMANARWKDWEESKLTEYEIKKDFDFLWQFAKEVEE